MSNVKTQHLLIWLKNELGIDNITLTALTGDAGFRCYYRFKHLNTSYIAVDAPPKYSNNQAFVDIQSLLQECQLNVPQIIAKDLTKGFFCLSDMGDDLLANKLTKANANEYYGQALSQLAQVVTNPKVEPDVLPNYDEDFIRLELGIFSQWLVEKHLAISLSDNEKRQLTECFDYLVDTISKQPKVFMHRDFHSRNIMVLPDNQLGIIDFQDAVYGPITYDLVSLVRDCYIRWPEDIVQPIVEQYRQLMQKHFSDEVFTKCCWHEWFDLTGLQRHLKASGIFARLHHRDGKPGYLKDIPLTLTYIQDVSAQYDRLSFLHRLIVERIIPAMEKEK